MSLSFTSMVRSQVAKSGPALGVYGLRVVIISHTLLWPLRLTGFVAQREHDHCRLSSGSWSVSMFTHTCPVMKFRRIRQRH